MPTVSIPLNDLKRYATANAERLTQVASAVLRDGRYVLGPSVAAFEESFARYCGVDHCIGVANGTDALELALLATGVRAGEEVLIAANAGMYAATAVLAAGAVPRFADVDMDTGLLTRKTAEDVLAARGSSTTAMIVTHLYGRMARMPDLIALADEHNLVVIEDCAQAHGAIGDDGRHAGSVGHAGCFSFYPTKNLGAMGDGGAVVCKDQEVASRLRQLRQYGWSRKYHNAINGGRNSRLDELQAAFLLAMLPELDRRNARRREIAGRYSRSILNPHIRVPDAEGHDYVAHLYVIRSEDRDGLAAHLASVGISSEVHYPVPDYRQPAIAAAYSRTHLSATEAACAESLTLPCFPELSDDECNAVIVACNAWRPK